MLERAPRFWEQRSGLREKRRGVQPPARFADDLICRMSRYEFTQNTWQCRLMEFRKRVI